LIKYTWCSTIHHYRVINEVLLKQS
jgi:hypothetical protein